MSEYGLKIKNIKAGTLFGYNQGIRDRYDYTDAMFSNSLFSKFIRNNGMNVWKDESTRDVICLEFDFGSRSYEEEMEHLNKILSGCTTEESALRTKEIIENVVKNKDNYVKKSKEEIREHFYENGVDVEYITKDKDGNIKKRQVITYKMLYRSSAKAKIGQVMFINKKLYKKAFDWLTMGIGNKMKKDNAKIVEMSAYAPLTTSTIVGEINIPVEDILILKDQDSLFKTIAKVVKSEDYYKEIKVVDEEKTKKNKEKAIKQGKFLSDGSPNYNKSYKQVQKLMKKCVVKDEEIDVKNTLWDGMALIESSFLPEWINGMALLRNHFFKTCGFRGHIQLFFKNWCLEHGHDYDTYEILDMFGISHKVKDIKMITTDNSIKWKKFIELMGDSPTEAYMYWCDKINADGSVFGIVKTDHPSKLGNVQQMSYQMINTLPCSKEDIRNIASTSVEYVELIKKDNDEFEKFLRKNSTEVNHYEMMADLYRHNKDFANSKWFREEKKKIINTYVTRLRKGKITIEADNLTVCGNPYALLLYSVGEEWEKDPTLNYEDGVIQCYTTRFNNGEYLCAIRNPHNSPNNIAYFHNIYSKEMSTYFPFSNNIIAVNCIQNDIQDRMNGCDFDSDFFFVTNHNIMVECAKKAYREYPTIVNKLNESGITYQNTMKAYADMDNKFAKSRMGIGESSNLAQLAMTYYWSEPNKALYDNFVILSVLAQVIIDGCKREYEVDGIEEIKRIKKLECMERVKEFKDTNGKIRKIKCDFPEFMKYTKEISYTKNGIEIPYEDIKESKNKIKNRIDKSMVCPMNWLQEVLNDIPMSSTSNTTPTIEFFIKIKGRGHDRQMSKIRTLIEEYNNYSKYMMMSYEDKEESSKKLLNKFQEVIDVLKSMRIGNQKTINRLVETSLGLETGVGASSSIKGLDVKYTRSMLNLLYRMDKEKFLLNFKK